ncbi:MAG: DNA mismatch repair endonuclease MutL [Deltaproteobacteria bacterium]|nr:DNA mismatch repair endonuclease MutL [Deltaproteobacteria bacterium]
MPKTQAETASVQTDPFCDKTFGMAKIKQLSPDLIQKIAAGEVIERPASVIKELVENAIDAGASHVFVSMTDTPSYTLKVKDDGEGMSKKDLAICLKSHTTSKISEFEDLLEVGSYGFRGEALSSIASVSKVTIKTCPRGHEMGWVLKLDQSIDEAVVSPGTEIEVQDLFYNTPARKKFLKSPQTEKAFMIQTLEELSLAASDVALSCDYNGKTVFSYAASDLENRIKTVYKKRWFSESSRFFTIEDSFKTAHLWGLCSEPSLMCPTSKHVSFFVNDRPIRDKVLSSAVKHAYASSGERGSFPYIILYLTLSGHDVDVNVHPQKREVRFKDSSFIHQWIVKNVQKGIQRHQQKRLGLSSEFVEDGSFAYAQDDGGDTPCHSVLRPGIQEFWIPDNASYFRDDKKEAIDQNHFFTLSSILSHQGRGGKQEGMTVKYSELNILGQIKKTYIVCETQEKMILIDQHAAHERIAFEKLLAQFKKSKIKKQFLLVPEQVELSSKETHVVKENLHFFEQIGFELSLLSGHTLAVKSLPSISTGVHPRALLYEILAELEEVPRGAEVLPQVLHGIFATIACHSVIRANQVLSEGEMKSLLNELDHLEYTQCPHGRPIAIDFPFKDLERRFKRT